MERTYNVLIADDEKNSRENISSLLLKYPLFKVRDNVSTGKAAYEALKQKSYDLAFLDVGMPGLTGIEVVKELKTKKIPLPYIVFVTAFTHLGAEAFDLGAIDYLIKPASEKRLMDTMRKFEIYNMPKKSKQILETFEEKLHSKFSLTSKEIEICKLIKDGFVKEDIQNKLCLSNGTIKSHLGHIYDKTNLTSSENVGRCDKFSRLLFLLFKL